MNSNEVVVEITYEVKFLKSTMFRYMIENGTNGEMTKWLKDLFNYLKEVCSLSSPYLPAFFILSSFLSCARLVRNIKEMQVQAVIRTD